MEQLDYLAVGTLSVRDCVDRVVVLLQLCPD